MNKAQLQFNPMTAHNDRNNASEPRLTDLPVLVGR